MRKNILAGLLAVGMCLGAHPALAQEVLTDQTEIWKTVTSIQVENEKGEMEDTDHYALSVSAAGNGVSRKEERPLDIVFLVDTTGSMDICMNDPYVYVKGRPELGKSRWDALCASLSNFMNIIDKKSYGPDHDGSEKTKVHYKVVEFNGGNENEPYADASFTCSGTDKDAIMKVLNVKKSEDMAGATNYEAPFHFLKTDLSSRWREDAKKVVVFISDGEPNCYYCHIDPSTEEGYRYYFKDWIEEEADRFEKTRYQAVNRLAIKEGIKAHYASQKKNDPNFFTGKSILWAGKSKITDNALDEAFDTSDSERIFLNQNPERIFDGRDMVDITAHAMNSFLTNYDLILPGVRIDDFYAIGLGEAGEDNMKVIADKMGKDVSGKSVYTYCGNEAELVSKLNDIAESIKIEDVKNAEMVDTLSEWVEVEDENAPLIISIFDQKTGQVIQQAKGTIKNPKSLSLGKGKELSSSYENKKLKLVFPKDYRLKESYRYALTTIIKPSKKAEDFARRCKEGKEQYPCEGEAGTGSGAGKKGLPSNISEESYFAYSIKGREKEKYFPTPVIRPVIPDPVFLSLSAEKKYFTEKDGKPRKMRDGEFTFSLKDGAGNLLQTKTNDKAGHILFESVKIDSEGTYQFVMTEVPGNDPQITYDYNEKPLRYTVKKVGRRYEVESDKSQPPVFINRHAAEDVGPLKARVVTTGMKIRKGMFKFELIKTEDENGPLSKEEKVATIENESDGDIVIHLPLTDDGKTYRDGVYQLSQRIPDETETVFGKYGLNRDRVVFDEQMFLIEVKQGNLTKPDEMKFTNFYKLRCKMQ